MPLRILLASALISLVSGCVSEEPAKTLPPQEYDLTDPVQYCQFGGKSLGDPWLNPYQKQVILERMRNAGCMG